MLAVWGIYQYGPRPHFFEHLTSYIMYPVLVVQHKIVTPIKHYFERNRSRKEMEELLQALQHEREELLAQNVQLNAMVSHYEQTKELVEFKKQFESVEARLSQVLVKHFSDQTHYFLIDKGSKAGIAPDMVAIYKNCLLGKVVEVYPQYSKVLLITDKMCKVASYCAHTQASGIHEGNNNEMLTGIRYMSHLAEVEPDDLVLSSGDGLVFPKGFALGKIKTCNSEGLFYDVSVEPLLDVRKIEYCFIIQKGAVLSEGAMNRMLMSLAEDHEKQVVAQKEGRPVTPAVTSEPIKVAHEVPQKSEENVQPQLTQADLMSAQELIQQQRLAWQAQAHIEQDARTQQSLSEQYNISL